MAGPAAGGTLRESDREARAGDKGLGAKGVCVKGGCRHGWKLPWNRDSEGGTIRIVVVKCASHADLLCRHGSDEYRLT